MAAVMAMVDHAFSELGGTLLWSTREDHFLGDLKYQYDGTGNG